jgi:hypothetical protein
MLNAFTGEVMIKYRNELLLLPSILLIVSFIAVAPEVFAACDCETEGQGIQDSSWVKSDKIIYFQRKGKIYKTKFNSDEVTLLADHGLDYASQVKLSPFAQYIFYSGHTEKEGFSSYIYDIKHKKDYKLQIIYHPGFITPEIEFSPDDKKAVWTEIDPRYNLKKFVIINLENMESESVAYPLEEDIFLGDYRRTEAKWSADANFIYLGTIAFPNGAYYKYDIVNNKMSKIDGRLNHSINTCDPDSGLHFVDSNRELPYYRTPLPQWQSCDKSSPIDGLSAIVDNKYNLVVTTPEGKIITVDHGGYTQCEGVTIHILSWLEGGKYLLYRKNSALYIYGIDENKKSILHFSENNGFLWTDN